MAAMAIALEEGAAPTTGVPLAMKTGGRRRGTLISSCRNVESEKGKQLTASYDPKEETHAGSAKAKRSFSADSLDSDKDEESGGDDLYDSVDPRRQETGRGTRDTDAGEGRMK
jgi:hypothetical protein